jgi:hypothetical protein
MNTNWGAINNRHNHSKPENDGGQLSSQNGIEAQRETPSQRTEMKVNNLVLGLPTNWRLTQPPPATMSLDFM